MTEVGSDWGGHHTQKSLTRHLAQENVVQHLNGLKAGNREADAWLTSWRHSADPASWNVAFALLHNTTLSSYEHHFAALCLHYFAESHNHWQLLPPGKVKCNLSFPLTSLDPQFFA